MRPEGRHEPVGRRTHCREGVVAHRAAPVSATNAVAGFSYTSAGDPTKYTAQLKGAGLTVFHVVPTLAAALKAVAAGVDGLVVESGPQRATLLPSVWDDLPTAEEFIGALWHKAGLMPEYWSPAIRLWRYTATVAESHVGRGPDCGRGVEAAG